jgi:hypothetical protein
MAEGGCVGPNDRPYTVAKMNEFVKDEGYSSSRALYKDILEC